MCHPFSSMFHHLTCLGTCWKPAPGSCCGGVGGMDGDATTPGGFERRGTFFCHGGPIGGDFNEENLWKPMKTLRQRKEHGGFQAKLMKNEHKQYRKWSIGQPIHQVFSPLRMAWDIWTWARCGSRVPWICWFQDVSRETNKQRDSIRLTRKI